MTASPLFDYRSVVRFEEKPKALYCAFLNLLKEYRGTISLKVRQADLPNPVINSIYFAN